LKNKLLTATLALSAAVLMTGCSGPASATPTVTVTVTAAAPSASPTASPAAAGAETPGAGAAGLAFEQSRMVVTSLVQGDKLSAIRLMTPDAAADVKSEDMKNYLFGGHSVKTCQVGSELKLTQPDPIDHGDAFSTSDAKKRADARVSAIEVVCDTFAFGFVVATFGPDSLVDGIAYHSSSDKEYFVGN
jgi:hypothetical protein